MTENDRMHIHMSGSEWFDTRAGGLNRYFDSLYTALRSNQVSGNFDVSAAAFGEPLPGGSSWGAPTVPLPVRFLRSMRGPKWSPNLVTDRHFSLYGRRSKGPEGQAPLVIHFQGPWAGESRAAGEGRLRVQLKHTFEAFRYRNADAYVVLSESFKGLLVNDYNVNAAKVRVIPPGVDLNRFKPTEGPTSGPSIICVRRLERRMGIDVLLEAWRVVIAKRPGAHLTIVGTGTEEGNLHQQAAALSLGSSVDFLGRVSDEQLAELYGGCSASVVPSLELEGFGLIALESLAAGRAPIVTNVGGLPDAVRGLDRSLILESGDVEALSDRIIAAVDGRVPSAAACREHAESFSWDMVARHHIELYESLL